MHKPHKLVSLIWSNCSDVAAFALSRANAEVMRRRFESTSSPLDFILFELAEEKADRAFLELGTLLRALDDAEDLSGVLSRQGDQPYGIIVKADEVKEDLYFRDMTNKILHAGGFLWQYNEEEGPAIVCVGNDPDRWVEARIKLNRLLALCSEIGIG